MSSQSDTWSQLQAHKRKRDSLRERLQKRRKERQVLLETGTSLGVSTSDVSDHVDTSIETETSEETVQSKTDSNSTVKFQKSISRQDGILIDIGLEKLTASLFCEREVSLPISVNDLALQAGKRLSTSVSIKVSSLIAVLEKLEAQGLVHLKRTEPSVIVLDCEYSKLEAVYTNGIAKVDSGCESSAEIGKSGSSFENENATSQKHRQDAGEDDVASLLSMPTMKEIENKKLGEEILELLNQPTAKEQSLVEKFKSQGGAMVREFCQFGTREECRISSTEKGPCKKLHFRKIIQPHTDESLGDCSFLNTCFHMDTCKYVHYEVDQKDSNNLQQRELKVFKTSELSGPKVTMTPPQWINCDVRYLDFEVLGKFAVVMADPPWDIHMELPYGTMADHEMKNLGVQKLQDDGYIFLWVTGRAIELGRECLSIWGYKRIDELIWVKTNQLQRLIRTGRTGHWINHGKEHCLVGVKGNPTASNFNRGLDCDVLVSEVRDTSHKPDEIYGLIERLAPGQRKIELFGRQHNVQPNWVTLGNQLNGVNLCDHDVVKKFREKYPDGKCAKPQPKSVPTVIELTPSQGNDHM